MVKKVALKCLFVCAHNSEDEGTQRITESIVAELLAGVDVSQLSSKEIQNVPFDYIRQVCFLPPVTEAE